MLYFIRPGLPRGGSYIVNFTYRIKTPEKSSQRMFPELDKVQDMLSRARRSDVTEIRSCSISANTPGWSTGVKEPGIRARVMSGVDRHGKC